ncbi:efflux RND transporter permease subunit [Ahrensia sp. R2A130]|uniref:efflux RND transporter permease subunit n=1 Tax=Ahrensia sp. R2A130 TaxID=744979 RepID=UPI0001E09C24|nr:efflux RND transporter permease subunit [Ahrensia sp. R2A130]EFL90627.1 acriflavin resistance protein [Ahrensia sp. R2A130]
MTSALSSILSRPKTVVMMMLVMIIAGAYSYVTIPKEAQPDIDVPVYFVSVVQQGISPGDAERLLVRPLETKLRGLDGLKELTTLANQSNAVAVLEFEIGTDKDKVLADIRDKVDQAKAEMPADADEPIINETNFALQPTLIVTLSGNVPERTLYQYSRRLKDELEAITSVREANLSGQREEMLEVVLDLAKLESYNITQTELLNALATNNQLVAAGTLDNGSGRFNLKVPGLVESAADVYSIPIKQNGEAVVTLGQVAEIRRTFKDPSAYTRVNGEPAIALQVVKRIGENIIENNVAVREKVAAFSKDWPSTIKINFLLDESSFINEVQGSLQASIMTAIALVLVVVVASLGLRSGMLVGLSVPVSFAVGFLILALAGITVNMMVLFGMVLTVGMLVDGAIVVTEYADRKLSEGMPADEAYKRAAQLMFWPVVSSTATTLAAFLPLLLWPGVPGEFMSYLPIMVIVVLTASLLTALIFLPTTGALTGWIATKIGRSGGVLFTAIVTSIMMGFAVFALTDGGVDLGLNAVGASAAEATRQMIGFDFGDGIATILGLVVALVTFPLVWAFLNWRSNREKERDPVTLMFTSERDLDIKKVPGALGGYLTFLKWTSGNLLGNALVMLTILGTAYYVMFIAFPSSNAGVEFFVDEEPDQAIVLISARGNLSASQVRDVVAEVDAKILTISGIRNSVSTATAPGGGGQGSPIGGVQDKPADVVGELQIELNDFCCRRMATEIFAEIRDKTAALPGVKVEVRKIEGGPPTGKDVRLQVKSTDYDAMVASVAKARAFVDGIAGLQDIEDGRPLPGIEWELAVDREQAGRYGANIVSIGSMVQLVTDGVPIGKYRPDDSEDELDIRVRLPAEERSFATLDKLKLPTTSGQVPLANFVTRSPQQKVSSITRKDGLYSMEVKANIEDGFMENGKAVTPDNKVAEVQAWLDQQTWPSSVQFVFKGADEEQAESMAFLGKAAIASLFLMFIILLTMYNSFWQTIITLVTVIFAVVGVLLGLMATGQKFSVIMTGTGVIALAGIVVNNAIVLIDTFNRLREEGVETREAVLKTSAQRLRPIMLTTVTTILGLVPMATQINMDFFSRTISMGGITSVWWVQLSTAIISGLAFSTILTLVMIPSMLALPANLAAPFKWTASKIAGLRARKMVAAVMDEEEPALADLNAMMRDARTAAPAPKAANKKTKKAVEREVVRDGEDASIVPMPAAANEGDNRKRPISDAAE